MNDQLSTTSVVSLFDTTKDERKHFVSDFLARYYSGDVSPLKAHYAIKCMEEIIKSITADHNYKEILLEEAYKNGKKFEYQNAEVSIKEAGVKYDYSKSGDAQLIELYEKQDELAKKIKQREEFLKNLPEAGLEILVGDELVKVYPPSKTSTTTVQFSLK